MCLLFFWSIISWGITRRKQNERDHTTFHSSFAPNEHPPQTPTVRCRKWETDCFKTEQRWNMQLSWKTTRKRQACLCFILDWKAHTRVYQGRGKRSKTASSGDYSCVSLFVETLSCSVVVFISWVHPQQSKTLSATRLLRASYILLIKDRPQGLNLGTVYLFAALKVSIICKISILL